MFVKPVLCIVACCALSLVQAQTPQDTKNKDMPAFLRQLADTRKTIADAYVQWTEAAKTGDVDVLAGMYTNDATMLPDEKEAVTGKDAIRAFYGDWLAERGKLVEEKFENINSFQEGDLLIDSTKYSGTLIKDGKEIRFTGKRLVVWQHQFQGPWKMVRDTWNKSPVP